MIKNKERIREVRQDELLKRNKKKKYMNLEKRQPICVFYKV